MTTLLNLYPDSVEIGSTTSMSVKIKVKKKMRVSGIYFYNASSSGGALSATPMLKNVIYSGPSTIIRQTELKWWHFPIQEVELQANVDYWIALLASAQCTRVGKKSLPI